MILIDLWALGMVFGVFVPPAPHRFVPVNQVTSYAPHRCLQIRCLGSSPGEGQWRFDEGVILIFSFEDDGGLRSFLLFSVVVVVVRRLKTSELNI